jgi:hypothetical protein
MEYNLRPEIGNDIGQMRSVANVAKPMIDVSIQVKQAE